MPDSISHDHWPSALGPRSLCRRQMVTGQLTAAELHSVIASLEGDALSAAYAGHDLLADLAYARAAALREMAR